MTASRDYRNYAAKMHAYASTDTDMEVDARFVDMIAARSSRILDIGCGIGNAVNGLRSRNHRAFGIDPTPEVLHVAHDLFDSTWFRSMRATDASAQALSAEGLPAKYDVILMSGNVPAFLTADELAETFNRAKDLLAPGGYLIIGTSTHARGGPADQDACASVTGLHLKHRYADWHLGQFRSECLWSVSVYSHSGSRPPADGPDGIFILGH
ncbi:MULTISPECIES: class I SAM-dependent methyltransferase [Brevibacterium]|uniref:Methyltransferase domain-containing protein n=2 Tax=Brevibacterium antiquum TaxID=234835 RepID=A0A2H1ITJ4_9MICO|nr:MULTISPECIES: class I SAM-dependent methyltransferase [Brevibacterium]SMX74496.1 Methyltransferase domain-containing protein [Brevibacterium antiquum]SMX78468.1 Methyltransferase domain-containing protein [Brevibacterium antiquum CNRZ 918]HCG55713.1 class I SAM-dependent methyltransferase [Brevibacterium sp.]